MTGLCRALARQESASRRSGAEYVQQFGHHPDGARSAVRRRCRRSPADSNHRRDSIRCCSNRAATAARMWWVRGGPTARSVPPTTPPGERSYSCRHGRTCFSACGFRCRDLWCGIDRRDQPARLRHRQHGIGAGRLDAGDRGQRHRPGQDHWRICSAPPLCLTPTTRPRSRVPDPTSSAAIPGCSHRAWTSCVRSPADLPTVWCRSPRNLDRRRGFSVGRRRSQGRPECRRRSSGRLSVAAIRLPRISNSTDVGRWPANRASTSPGSTMRGAVAAADIAIVPGTRATVSDLAWLRSRHRRRTTNPGRTGPADHRDLRRLPMLARAIVDDVESGADASTASACWT